MRGNRAIISAGVLALLALPATALADGRPGLWEQKTTMTIGGAGMPKMPAIPADKLAQLKAMGLEIPDLSKPQTTVIKTCLTEEELAKQKMPKPEDMGNCSLENRQMSGDRMSGDLICKGEIEGKGHIEYVFDSDTHYTGSMTFKGARQGQAIEMSHSAEGTWLADDCGGVD